MSVKEAKQKADELAEAHAAFCRQRAPSPLAAALIPTNYRFFRRLAGFAGRDAKERDDEAQR